MKQFLQWLIGLGTRGLLMAAILDGAGLPIPGGVDALIIFLASRKPEETFWLGAVAVLGSTLGNFILFLLARRGGELYLRKRASSKRSQKFRQWFDHYGLLTVFIAALIPLPIMPMKIFVLFSGALGSSIGGFLIAFVIARLARYFALAYLGKSMGDHALEYLASHLWHLAALAAVLFGVLFVLIKIMDRRRALRSAPLPVK